MVCPQCTADCPPESLFCLRCGSGLRPGKGFRCPGCLTAIPRHSRFCLSCGAPVVQGSSPDAHFAEAAGARQPSGGALPQSLHRLLPAQYIEKLAATRGSVDGERRVVTILFSDVKGSTALAEHLDPEEVLEIMNGAFEVLIAPITRYEGTLARLMGDAIMAFFGAPIAHEDDPVRACHAALDIVEGARQYAARLERERGVKGFNVRVGLNTGLVVVAEVGSDLRVEYTAMGDAVNLAARMETAAEPGTVLLTGATLDHVRHAFDTETVGPVSVKGKSEPVQTYRLLRPKISRADSGHDIGNHSSMIGREAELVSLQSRLLALEKGAGGIVCITGEMGMGKSRLVREARAMITTPSWIETRSYAYTEGMSYRTLRQLLQGLPGGRPESGGGEAAAGHQESPREGSPGQPVGPYLSKIMGAPVDARLSRVMRQHHPEDILPHVIQELQALLRAEASARPLVLVWESLQWIDPSSLIVLESILPLVEDVPILFVLLFRTDGDRMGLFGRRISDRFPQRSTSISLERLDRASSARLLEKFFAGRNVPRDMRENIIERAGGNPLFLKEIARQLMQTGTHAGGVGVAAQLDDHGSFSLPDTLRGVIMARIDALPPKDRHILQTASVLGRSFQAELLKAILPGGISGGDITLSLEELVRREFIVHQSSPDPNEAPHDLYSFGHSLAHEVAHESMLLTQRKELHGLAARAIRGSYTGDPASLAEILAVHYEIAGEREEAFQCLMEAGERAKSLYAHLEAISYYRRALKLATEMGIGGAMLRNLYEGLADVYTIAAKYPAALEQYGRALELPQNVRRRAALHRKKGVVYEKSGLYDDAATSFKEALAVLQNTIDLAESARIYGGLSRVCYLQGKYRESVELSGLAKEIFERRADTWEVASACDNLGLAYMKLEEPAHALREFQHAMDIRLDMDDSSGLSATYNNLGQYCHQLGDYRAAAAHFLKSIDLCRQTGNRHGLASAYDNLGQSLALEGRSEEATTYLARAVEILADIGSESTDLVPELWQRSGIW